MYMVYKLKFNDETTIRTDQGDIFYKNITKNNTVYGVSIIGIIEFYCISDNCLKHTIVLENPNNLSIPTSEGILYTENSEHYLIKIYREIIFNNELSDTEKKESLKNCISIYSGCLETIKHLNELLDNKIYYKPIWGLSFGTTTNIN